MRRALVIQHLKYGDVAQTLPALQALREEHPDWEIWLVGSRPYLDYLEGRGLVDRLAAADFESQIVSPRAIDAFAASIVRALPDSGWELAVNLSHSPQAGRIIQMLPAKRKAGFMLLDDGSGALSSLAAKYLFAAVAERRFNRIHLSDIYKWMVGSQMPTAPPILRDDAEEVGRIKALLRESGWDGKKTLVAMQLGAARRERMWPVHLFARLGRMLAEVHGLQPVLIGSPQEAYLADAYTGMAPGTAIDLVGQLPMASLPSFFRVVDVLIGSDTGPIHVAAMSGCKVVGLYFVNSWVFETGPYGEGHIVLQARPRCAPCFLRSICQDRPCAEMIQPEHVVTALRLLGVVSGSGEAFPREWSEQVEIFRSTFDVAGRQRYVKLAPRSQTAEDALCRALETAVTSVLLPGNNKASIETEDRLETSQGPEEIAGYVEDLRKFRTLARAAAEQAERIEKAVRSGRAVTALRRLGRTLEGLDAEINNLGRGAALMKAYIVEAQRLLLSKDLRSMAAESRENYSTAARIAARALELLEPSTVLEPSEA